MEKDIYRFARNGDSKPLESIQNSEDILKAILEFVDQIIPNEPFLVCGYSYGGYIARGITYFRRNLVHGMLLFAPGIVMDSDKRDLPEQEILKKDPTLISRLPSGDAAEFDSMAVIQGESEWKRFRDEILIPSRNAKSEFLDKIRKNGDGFTFDLDESPPFEYPALIITGRQDHIVGFKDALQLIDKYPRGTFAIMDMAGHNLQIEQSNMFEALVINWLKRLETIQTKEQ